MIEGRIDACESELVDEHAALEHIETPASALGLAVLHQFEHDGVRVSESQRPGGERSIVADRPSPVVKFEGVSHFAARPSRSKHYERSDPDDTGDLA